MLVQMLFTTALVGLSGSFHCALMCGSLAGVACRQKKYSHAYYLSRLLAYMFLGFISGLLTSTLIKPQYFLTSSVLAIAFAVLMLALSILQLVRYRRANRGLAVLNPPTPSRQSRVLGTVFRFSPFSEPVTIGLVSAFLPCGFLYLAVVQAALFANPFHGALAMGVFALVTSPALWISAWITRSVSHSRISMVKYFVPILAAASALTILWRSVHVLEAYADPQPQHEVPRCH